jgi:hypothetical protein
MIGTGERVEDVARLRHLRETRPEALCAVRFLDEATAADRDVLQRSLAFPDTIVASDAMPLIAPAGARDAWPPPAGTVTHPRTSGTFAKTVRIMVRETGRWSWVEVFRRCSWLPARVLGGAAAAKGHLGVGADADLVVLAPDEVTDRATYAAPVTPSSGSATCWSMGNC